jgi:phospholipid transport system substrate-binding protein
VLISSTVTAQQIDPVEQVAQTFDQIVRSVEPQREALRHDIAATYRLVDQYLGPQFDFYLACEWILTEQYWPERQEERDRFVGVFYTYLVAAYGDLLSEFDDQTFQFLPLKGDPAEQRRLTVNSILTLNDGTRVNVDLLMISDEGRDWLIVDVIAKGSSYVNSYRKQFRSRLAQDGLGGLIEWLTDKTTRLRESRGL